MLDTSFESEKNTENVSILTILCFLPQLLQTILEGLKSSFLFDCQFPVSCPLRMRELRKVLPMPGIRKVQWVKCHRLSWPKLEDGTNCHIKKLFNKQFVHAFWA
jgi:hypothetical protein